MTLPARHYVLGEASIKPCTWAINYQDAYLVFPAAIAHISPVPLTAKRLAQDRILKAARRFFQGRRLIIIHLYCVCYYIPQ